MVTVRPASQEDVPVLVALGQAFTQMVPELPADPERMQAALGALVPDETALVLVAERDEEVVGALLAALVPVWWHPGATLAQELAWYVVPAARASGAGLQLVCALETWARERGACAVLMTALACNPGVTQLYQRLGYGLYESHFLKRL